MGIYDRPYLQDEEYGGGSNWAPGRSMVVTLVILNAVIWIANGLVENQINPWLALPSDLLDTPWQVWRFVTYGFAHGNFGHVLFNMIGLFIFGRDIEGIYGRFEFLRIYLAAIVLAGLVWFTMQIVSGQPAILLGASGGVLAIVMLWILHFPMRLIYIWGVLPVRAWALGTFYIVGDLLGLMGFLGTNQDGPQVANIAHLTGVAFAYAYYRGKLNLGRLIPARLSDLKPRFRPKLRIHDPETKSRDLSREVDAILEKISREGEGSLTRKERKTLEEASRQYQRRKQT
jgi:membrane associated rhomboid family serine protease